MKSLIKNIAAYLYLSFTYIIIGVIGYWKDGPYPYPMDSPAHILFFSVGGGLFLICITAAINVSLKPDLKRLVGALVLALFYIGVIIASTVRFDDFSYLSFFWPAIICLTLLQLINFESAFKKWNRKDLFHGFLIVFAIACILYFFWLLNLGSWVFRQTQSARFPLSNKKDIIANIILTASLAPGVLFMLAEILSLSHVFRFRYKKKYCAVRGNGCHEVLLRFRGVNSAFFAYPFERRYAQMMNQIKGEMDSLEAKRLHSFRARRKQMSLVNRSVSTISDRLWKLPHSILLPTEHAESPSYEGILFCKICKMIHSVNVIVAELSALNLNVIFEIGFAIANGKKAIIFVKKGHNEIERVPTLNTLPLEIYSSDKKPLEVAQFVHDELSRLLADDPLYISRGGPSQTAFLPAKRIKTVRNSVLLQIPHTFRALLLQKTITANNKNILSLPKERNLAAVIESLLKAERIIVLLAKENGNQVLTYANAEAVFLAALAVGLNKKTLVIKHASKIGMVDLRGVTKEVSSLSELKKIAPLIQNFLHE